METSGRRANNKRSHQQISKMDKESSNEDGLHPVSQSLFDFGSHSNFLKYFASTIQSSSQSIQKTDPKYKTAEFWLNVPVFKNIQMKRYFDPEENMHYAVLRKENTGRKCVKDSIIRIGAFCFDEVSQKMKKLISEIESTHWRKEIPSLKDNPYATEDDILSEHYWDPSFTHACPSAGLKFRPIRRNGLLLIKILSVRESYEGWAGPTITTSVGGLRIIAENLQIYDKQIDSEEEESFASIAAPPNSPALQ
ncbi:hypothetical protein Fcan01_19806 [Folsomia candida]|uniref:Uncharacterized protein n=1 Tax=Folsomia candida TaxID=158441 RepID=A0A226DIT4_FOLCA|nr:hypothetical protein Fcan01_19806 [Folsomia candida]